MQILKRILIVLGVLVIIFVALAGFYLSRNDLFGWRLDFTFGKVETNDYHSYAPTISFRYPTIFEVDLDTEHKYGKTYLAGIKLKTDNRTGCDIRTGGPELNFSLSDKELADEVVGVIQAKATEFKLVERKKMKLGGREAFRVSFSFLDPIGSRVQLDQTFTENDGTRYMIICGAGEQQHKFFNRDFQLFYNSVTFAEQIVEQKPDWWKKLEFWKK